MPIESTNNIVYAFLTEPRFRIGRHALLILMLIGYSVGYSLSVSDGHTGGLSLIFYVYWGSYASIQILFAYFNIYYLAPHFLLRDKYTPYFAILLGILCFLLVVKKAVDHGISVHLELDVISPVDSIMLLNYIIEVITTLICVSGYLIPLLLRMWMTDKKRIADIEGQKLKSSIEEFKEQINPDLLFCTIRHASEEVKREPRKASELIMCLSDLLRYELYDCKRTKVLLKSDIDFVRNYLSLVQKVVGNFSFSISIEGNINQFVCPFLFMPFLRETLNQLPDDMSLFYVIDKSTITLKCMNKDNLLGSNTINLSLSK